MSRATPLISIGVTCYNAADTIDSALSSAVRQDWPNFEVIVVDDASRDRSPEILEQWKQRDSRIKIHTHPSNQGCAAARNTILREASGAFVAFFDDDDISIPGRLRRQYERIISYEKSTSTELVACYTSGARLYPNGYAMPIKAIGSQPREPRGREIVDYLLTFTRVPRVFYGAGTPTCSLMARIETFRAVDGFDEAMRRQEDADFAIRLGFKGCHFIGTIEPLVVQNATAGSEKDPLIEQDSLLRLLEKNRDYLNSKNLYEYMLGWSEIRFRHFNGQPLLALSALLRLGVRFPARTVGHFLTSASRRFIHERKIGSHRQNSAEKRRYV
jgi:glycosyltransferase involved in cell wall biosynthesis